MEQYRKLAIEHWVSELELWPIFSLKQLQLNKKTSFTCVSENLTPDKF